MLVVIGLMAGIAYYVIKWLWRSYSEMYCKVLDANDEIAKANAINTNLSIELVYARNIAYAQGMIDSVNRDYPQTISEGYIKMIQLEMNITEAAKTNIKYNNNV